MIAEDFSIPSRRHSIELDYSLEKLEKCKFKIRKKIGQIQNKACFFEGQLNPLAYQNKILKDRIVELSKIISTATEQFRNLLPSQNNPVRKLKIQMANLQEVSLMIKEDWIAMKDDLQIVSKQLQIKNAKVIELEQRYSQSVKTYEATLFSQQSKYEKEIAGLKNDKEELIASMQNLQRRVQQEKSDIIAKCNKKLELAEKLKKQHEKEMSQMQEKLSNQEKVSQRLRDEMASNLVQFEKSRLNLKQIYDTLMKNKLQQQQKQFEFILKQKDLQKTKIIEEMIAQHDQLKQKINEKNFEMNHLSGLNESLRQQLGGAKNQLWALKIQYEQHQKQFRENVAKLEQEQEKNNALKDQLQQSKQKMTSVEQRLQSAIAQYERQLRQQKQKTDKLIQTLRTQLVDCHKKIEDSQTKISEYQLKLQQNDKNYQEVLEQEKRRLAQITQKLEKQKNQLMGEIKKNEQEIKKKQLALKDYQQKIIDMEQSHQNKLKNMELEFQKKISDIKNQNQEIMNTLTKDYQKKINDIEQSNNQYVNKLVAEQNKILAEQEKKYKQLEEQSANQIKQMQAELVLKQQMNKKLQNECNQILQKMNENEQQHKKQMEEQRKQSEQRMAEQTKKMMDKMQQQTDNMKKVMDDRQSNYKNQLNKIQDELHSEITMLKQEGAVEVVEERYIDSMGKLKEELEAEIRRIAQEKDQKIKDLQEEFNKDLIVLSQKLEFDISKLNEELLAEGQVNQFTNMPRHQKVQYLIDKIGEYRNEMMDKDNQILQLNLELGKKNQQLGRVDQLIEQKMKMKKMEFERLILELKSECDERIKKNARECEIRIKQIETERIAFTESLYNEFQQIKKKYDEEIKRLVAKYDELERIFEERPSRAQDVTKIKCLIEDKEKIVLEMKEYKKKINQANEIVKYLNLQLQNYKETYDIFGKGTQPLSPQRKNQLDIPISAMRSIKIVKKQHTPRGSEQGEVLSPRSPYCPNSKEQKLLSDSGGEISEFRIFPSIYRKKSQVVFQADEESKGNNQEEELERQSKIQEGRKRNGTLPFEDDKSQQLKSNASIFLNLLSNDQKSPIEIKRSNKSYRSKNSMTKRSINGEKKYQIKQKTVVFQH